MEIQEQKISTFTGDGQNHYNQYLETAFFNNKDTNASVHTKLTNISKLSDNTTQRSALINNDYQTVQEES